MCFYLSDANLPTDIFLLMHVDVQDGSVPVALLASFGRMREFGASTELTEHALASRPDLFELHVVRAPDGRHPVGTSLVRMQETWMDAVRTAKAVTQKRRDIQKRRASKTVSRTAVAGALVDDDQTIIDELRRVAFEAWNTRNRAAKKPLHSASFSRSRNTPREH